ncbi:hypothetical protein BC628DRAFT_1309080, partial [Trametes gibbosa]
LQARTGTLVSGSCALQFFARTRYPDSDLDLYVHMRHRREVGRWLLQEGYAYAPAPHQHAQFELEVVHGMSPRKHGIYSMPGVAGILTFKRPAPERPRTGLEYPEDVQEEGEGEGEEGPEEDAVPAERVLKVQIIVTKNTPMEAILAFHSTCVMNVLTYEKAYCLFPRATLEERRSLLSSSCRGRSKRRAVGLAKYARRGFTLLSALAPDDIEPDPAPAPAAASSTSRYTGELAHAPFLYGMPTALALVRSDDTALHSPTGLLTPGPTPPPPPPPSSSSLASASASTPAPTDSPRPHRPAFRLGWRWIDDSASWVLPLPQDGVQPPPAPPAPRTRDTPAPPHDPAAVCNWEVRYPAPAPAPALAPGALMHFDIAAGKALRYRYLVTDPELLAFLRRELGARTRAEELKRGAELEEWSYYDWELPALCREFLHGLARRRLASLRIE